MVDVWDLPDIFLTFIADKVSDTRWQEVNVIKRIAKHYNACYTWKYCPIKCVTLFHTRVHLFMHKHLLSVNGLLGRIEHHAIRYEIQKRGSLHAHLILWVHEAADNKLQTRLRRTFRDTNPRDLKPRSYVNWSSGSNCMCVKNDVTWDRLTTHARTASLFRHNQTLNQSSTR